MLPHETVQCYRWEEIKLSNSPFCSVELDAYFPDRQHAVRIKITSTAKWRSCFLAILVRSVPFRYEITRFKTWNDVSCLSFMLWQRGHLSPLILQLPNSLVVITSCVAEKASRVAETGATVKYWNRNPEPGIRHPESGIRNPGRTGNRNPNIKENKFFKFVKMTLLSVCL